MGGWYSTLRGGFRISYDSLGPVQLTFLRLMSSEAHQNFTYTCINSAAWFDSRSGNHNSAIKLQGDNDDEFSPQTNKPNILLDGCKTKEVEERPLLQRLEGKTAHFKDGTSAEVDVIMMCTGYLHKYDFLREELRLKSKNVLYPPGLYKGLIWQEGGNNKLLYCGVQDQYYTYTMFDVCALWIVKYIEGELSLPDKATMQSDWKAWVAKNKACKDYHDEIDFQTDYVQELARDCGSDYPYDLDVSAMFHTWENHKTENILTYRDKSFASKYTGVQSPVHHTNFMYALDDSMETFMH